jgi:uncharacterized repeat protein (TIGR01451 family)
MKRTLVGLLALSSLVGMGALGVYYAQHKLSAQAVAAPPEKPAREQAADLTPIPIPIANRAEQGPVQPVAAADEPPGAANPFVAQSGAAPDRYPPQADPPREIDEPATSPPRELSTTAAADEIPDARALAIDDGPQQPARTTRTADPYAEQPAGEGRYAAQPAAAEVAEEEQPAQAEPETQAEPEPASADRGEPRRLGPEDGENANNREAQDAANPLRSSGESRLQPPPAARRSAPEPFPDQKPAAERNAPTEVVPDAPRRMVDERQPLAGENPGEGSGRPGDPQLSGPQSPALVIEKAAPAEIQIGKPAKIIVKVVNSGSAMAHDVAVHDQIPRGTQLLDTTPPAKPGADGSLVWELGSLKPGQQQQVEMQVMPTAEGEVGSVASVEFRAEASVRTVATRPMLNLEVFGPSKVNKGEPVALKIKLSNPGSGAATGIVLSETVPDGLSHEAGKELEVDIGTLAPGQSRELDLTLSTTAAGVVTNVVLAKGEGKLEAESRSEIEIVAPQLQVTMSGPKRRILERNATHSISISNPGTAPAKDIDLVAVLPRTLKFVEANNGGQFDEATHAVYWNLEELPPQQTGTVKLTTLPLEAGEARLLIKGASKDGLADQREEVLAIEGLAAINFQLSDVKDPIEVGAETAYEIRVTNQGTKAATNVRLGALVPRGMKPLSGDGPTRYRAEGQHVLFEPIKQLAPKSDATFTIKVKAIEPGDQRLEVQVATDEIREPVSKQESTRVYGEE